MKEYRISIVHETGKVIESTRFYAESYPDAIATVNEQMQADPTGWYERHEVGSIIIDLSSNGDSR